jgi:hypothetical protein
LALKQQQKKFEIRILACQSRFAECELFQKNLLIFDIAAKRRKNQISGLVNSMCKESWPEDQDLICPWERLLMITGVETQPISPNKY